MISLPSFAAVLIYLCLVATAAEASDHHINDILLSFLASSPYGRDRVIDLIVSEYTNANDPKHSTRKHHNRIDSLDDAIYAMEMSETDGEPVPVKGHDFLFIGSVGASLNEKSLHENGITHVINWSSKAKCNLFDGIEYLCMDDTKTRNKMIRHIDELDRAVELVESVRKSGGRVLSHCWHGRNRSVSLAVAYLMKYEGMTSAEATDVVRRTRPQADPWWDVLDYYSRHYLRGKKSVADERKALDEWEDGTRARRLRGSAVREELDRKEAVDSP